MFKIIEIIGKIREKKVLKKKKLIIISGSIAERIENVVYESLYIFISRGILCGNASIHKLR